MEENQSVFEMGVDQSASRHLFTAFAWARFMAIFILVVLGLMLILFFGLRQEIVNAFGKYIPGADTGLSFGVVAVALIIAAVICVVLMILLLKAAIHIRRGIQTKNQQTFNTGLASLKAYFTMYGVIAVITLLLNIISSFR